MMITIMIIILVNDNDSSNDDNDSNNDNNDTNDNNNNNDDNSNNNDNNNSNDNDNNDDCNCVENNCDNNGNNICDNNSHYDNVPSLLYVIFMCMCLYKNIACRKHQSILFALSYYSYIHQLSCHH